MSLLMLFILFRISSFMWHFLNTSCPPTCTRYSSEYQRCNHKTKSLLMWDVPPLPSTSVKILAVPAHPSQVSPPLCNVDQCSPELNKCMWKTNKQTCVCESPGDPGDMKTDSVGLTWGLKFSFLTSSQMILVLLVQGYTFKYHLLT